MQLRGSFWRGSWAHVRRAIKAARPSLERFRWGKSSSLKSRLNSASVALGLSQIIVAQAALRPTGPATAAQGGKQTSQRARRGANFAPSNRILRPDPLRIRPLQCQRADVRRARSQLMQSVRRHTGSFANDLTVEPQWNDQQGVALLPLTVPRAARPTSSSPSVAGSGTTCCSVTLS